MRWSGACCRSSPCSAGSACCWRSTGGIPTCSVGTGWRSGGSSSFRRNRCRSPRPSGPPRGSSSRSPPCSWRRPCSAGPPPTTTPRTAASSASTWPGCSPTTLTRTWHLQLALFVVSAAFLAGGIFLAPLIAGREPRGQGLLSYVLLGALVVVVVGSLDRRGAQLPRGAQGEGPADVRGPGVGVPGPRPVLADPADRRDAPVDRHHVPRPPAHGWRPRAEGTCPTCSSTAPCRSRSSTPSGWRAARGPRSRSATSGGSGSSTCGSRTSWSCSPPSWSRTSSCCSGWCRRGLPCG